MNEEIKKDNLRRTDVRNIIDSVNMTLKDYNIRFEFDDREDLRCVSDGVPDLITQSNREVLEEFAYYIAEDDAVISFDMENLGKDGL